MRLTKESLNLQNTSPITPDQSFYTPTIFILISTTENPLISPNETPITTKSTDLSPDLSKNFTKL